MGRELFAEKLWMLVPAQEIIAEHVKSLQEWPPRQRAATLSLQKAMAAVMKQPEKAAGVLFEPRSRLSEHARTGRRDEHGEWRCVRGEGGRDLHSQRGSQAVSDAPWVLRPRWLILALLVAVGASGSVHAESKGTGELAKAAQNPIANMVSLPFQNNTGFNYGPRDGTVNTLNIQPVFPVSLSKGWRVINRAVVPVVSQPGLLPGQDRKNGLGNTTFTSFFSPKDSGRITWGVGPTVLLPASDERLGPTDYGGGVSFVALAMPGHWVVGSLFSQVWSFGGGDARPEAPPHEGESFDEKINLFTWQYFVNYNLPKGWYITSAPIITRNQEASSGNRWTVPLGGGVGKLFKAGSQHMNASVQAFYNVEKPEFGADWSMRLQLQFLFPK